MNKKPLNVLLVFGHRKKLGAARMVAALERKLQQYGIKLFLAVENRDDFNDYPNLAPRIFEVKGLTDWRTLRGKFIAARLVMKLMGLLKELEARVLYVHHLAAFPYAFIASNLASVPHVVAIRNVEKKSRYKKFLLHRAKNVLAVSNSMLDIVGDYIGTNGKMRKFVVHNGIDIDAFLSSAAGQTIPAGLKPPDGNVVIGMVSSMNRHKDPQFLLRVARRVIDVEPTVNFLFVGRFPDPEYEKETRSLAGHLNIEPNVIFGGQQENISPFFAALDILAHPRPQVPEAFGLALIEAMAHAKPIVASRIGGISEIVRHNETGFLCEPGNEDEFAEALLKLIREPALRREYGDRGGERVRQAFSIEKTAADMADVFRAVAGN